MTGKHSLLRPFWRPLFLSLAVVLLAVGTTIGGDGPRLLLDNLRRPVRTVRDVDGTVHIFARTDHDALMAQGYLHAEDRLFQMDYLRRLFSGTLAELLGASALSSDVQIRAFGFRRSAEESYQALDPQSQALLRAYAAGVNAFLNDDPQLPEEYQTLDLTEVEAWSPVDTLTVVKGIAFARSFDFSFEVESTLILSAYQEAGAARGFDGTALFFEDLFRAAPFDSATTVPSGLTASTPTIPSWISKTPRVKDLVMPQTLRMAKTLLERFRLSPLRTFRTAGGSNVWAVAGGSSASGSALLANDPHLGLDVPSLWHESHLVVSEDPALGAMDASGVTVPGIPGITIGCGAEVCWGITTDPADIADTFQESLVYNVQLGVPTATRFEGGSEALTAIPQSYRVNQIDGNPNHLTTAAVPPLQGGRVFLVPRRNNGPLISIDVSNPNQAVGLSFQYTGARDTRDWEGLYSLARARNVEDFGARLSRFDATFNFVCADKEGKIGYFASGEIPLREDLQNLGLVDGLPPFLIRDGTHARRNEWVAQPQRATDQSLRYAILPAGELPHAIVSGNGFLLNANNDPLGDLADNDATDQTRPAGGIRYLLWQSLSLRAGAIERRLKALLQLNQKVSLQDMRDLQAMTRLADAEVFRPYLATALDNARRAGAPALLASLANDARVTQAVQRLEGWDLTSPTGLSAGYDAGDNPSSLPAPSTEEIANSVAATIYSLWRGRLIANVIDATLSRSGLDGLYPNDFELPLTALKNLLQNFGSRQGIGASGLNFFQVAGLAGADARDYVLLKSLRDGLDLAASQTYAAAFGRSQNQDDYRWGRLHRVIFRHPLGGPFNIPPAGGFAQLSANLPGLSRQGGFETIDNGPGSLRGSSLDSFTFDTGASVRLTVEMNPSSTVGSIILPGGQSGRRTSPLYANQLARWLVDDYHPLRISDDQVAAATQETIALAPSAFRLYFPFFATASDFFTGFAAASLSDSDQTVTYQARSGNGANLPLPNNPAATLVSPGRQSAQLSEQVFSIPAGQPETGWVELTSNLGASETPPIASFAQFGSFDLSRLDGAVASDQPYSRLVFTRVYEGPEAFRGHPAETVLNIANVDNAAATLRLRYFNGSSATAANEATIALPGKGSFSGNLSAAFGRPFAASAGYVEATSTGSEIVGFELVRLQSPAGLIGLNAVVGEPSQALFSAQVASTESIFTSLKLVNLSNQARSASLEFVSADGSQLSPPVEVGLGPGESWEENLLPEFALGGGGAVGSLRLVSDGVGIVGDVVFGAPDGEYAAALPLQGRPSQDAVFPHVANLFGAFFTGLALYNPSSDSADVGIEVFTPGGTMSGSSALTLGAGARLSQTLDQLVPDTAGQVGGYVVIRSTQALVAQELFGTTSLSVLSAVPPTRIR